MPHQLVGPSLLIAEVDGDGEGRHQLKVILLPGIIGLCACVFLWHDKHHRTSLNYAIFIAHPGDTLPESSN